MTAVIKDNQAPWADAVRTAHLATGVIMNDLRAAESSAAAQ
jgi:hypothetical protein